MVPPAHCQSLGSNDHCQLRGGPAGGTPALTTLRLSGLGDHTPWVPVPFPESHRVGDSPVLGAACAYGGCVSQCALVSLPGPSFSPFKPCLVICL